MTPRLPLVVLLVALQPALASADATCANGVAERSIVVEPAAGGAPCTVRYTKEPGGYDEVLWRAKSDRHFCDEKAADVVGRLVAAGWVCDGETADAARPDPAPLVASPAPAVTPTTPARTDVAPPALPSVSAPPVAVPSIAAPPGANSPVAPPPLPIARIEAPPPEFEPEPLSLRDRIVLDPRMRFYRSSFGEATFREGLRIVPVDLNRDDRDELFLQVDLPEVCGDAPCTWDLFELRPDGSLAALGVRRVVAWRVLAERRDGYPDLAVRFAGAGTGTGTGEAEYGVFRFELGMYRAIGESVSSDVFASDSTPMTPR